MINLSKFSMPTTENGLTSTLLSKPTIIPWLLGSKPDTINNGISELSTWEKTNKVNPSATNLTDSNKKSVFLTTWPMSNVLWTQCGKLQETVSCLSVSATRTKNTKTKISESFRTITSWTSRQVSSEKPSSRLVSIKSYLSTKDTWVQPRCSEHSISNKENHWRLRFITSTMRLNKSLLKINGNVHICTKTSQQELILECSYTINTKMATVIGSSAKQ